jgi:hypothetical protein
LKGAYQKVSLFRAEQLIQEGNQADAGVLLDKSLSYRLIKALKQEHFSGKVN